MPQYLLVHEAKKSGDLPKVKLYKNYPKAAKAKDKAFDKDRKAILYMIGDDLTIKESQMLGDNDAVAKKQRKELKKAGVKVTQKADETIG